MKIQSMGIRYNFCMRRENLPVAIFTLIALSALTVILLIITAPPRADLSNFIAYATIQPAKITLVPETISGEIDPYQPTPTPTPKPGEITIPGVVQVNGTEGTGLRFRQSPDLEGEELFMGFDTEVFNVLDGPRQADGYTWYFLAAVNDANRKGWAVSQFLMVIPE
ncbi:MAG TPA: hypothetical protein VN226_02045 [Anaerolineales bacterium]|nr:hypothetical protein [Anaerolineales bacterium]